MSTPVLEMTWSEFLRNASDVAARLEEGDVVLRRRDGETVRLTLETRAQAHPAAVDLLARLMGVALGDEDGARRLSERLVDALPWARFLPEEDRSVFLGEVASCAEACAAVDVWAPLDQLVREWRHTAAVYADPGSLSLLTRHHSGDFGRAAPPDAE